jgi:DNA-binding protein Fis
MSSALRTASRACADSPALGSSSGSLAECVSELLAAAGRGEIENAHAALIEVAERELFTQAIQLAKGNQAKAARWLGISRITMREKLTRLGLHPGRDEQPPMSNLSRANRVSVPALSRELRGSHWKPGEAGRTANASSTVSRRIVAVYGAPRRRRVDLQLLSGNNAWDSCRSDA